MILATIEQLAAQYLEAARCRARTYVGKGKAGAVGPVVCADGTALDVLSLPLPLTGEGRAAVEAWEARAASGSWPAGRSVRVEVLNGASEPLGSRSLPGHHWSGAAAPGAATVRPPWGPAGPGPMPAPAAEPPPVWIDDAPRWPEAIQLMTGGARPAVGGPVAASVADPVAVLAGVVDRLLRHSEAILAQNSALVQSSVASQSAAHQTAARVLVESAAQHGQTARSAHAQLASLSGTVARAAADAQQRADDEAALSRAASEAAAESDKAAAVAEVLRAAAGQAGGGDDRWAQMLKLATAALGSGAVRVTGPRPVEAAAQLGAPVDAPPVEAPPVDPAPWPDQLVSALMAAQHDPEAAAKLQAVGALLPADVRAAIAGGVAS